MKNTEQCKPGEHNFYQLSDFGLKLQAFIQSGKMPKPTKVKLVCSKCATVAEV